MAFINRELSWIQFNERVLHQATLSTTPFFEKGRFLHIASNNLDEFYMVRVGSLQELSALVESNDNKTNLTITQQLKLISKKVQTYIDHQAHVYDAWMKEAHEHHIHVKKVNDLKSNDQAYIQTMFKSHIEPLLSPMVVDQSHPFPFLQNKQVVVVASLKKGKKITLGLIPLDPNIIPLVISLPSTSSLQCIMVSDLIHMHIQKIFKGYEVEAITNMRLIRNADLDYEGSDDEELTFKDVMKKLLKKRQRLAVVRAEFNHQQPDLIKEVVKRVSIKTQHVFINPMPLHFAHLKLIEQFCLKRLPNAFFPPLSPRNTLHPYKEPMMELLKKQDMFLHVPYDKLDPLILLLKEASMNPKVISIKMTLYRLSSQSSIIESLVRAAQQGKEVVVVIELKARFDEQHNIDHATTLEEAGCQVIYGFEGYKVHSKCCLITEVDKGKMTSYTHTSTGNYNEVTAKLYTDYHVLSTNPVLGEDIRTFFTWLQLGDIEAFKQSLNLLSTSPFTFKQSILHHIHQEIAIHLSDGNGHIIFKMNSMTDKDIMEALILADQHGVKVDLIIRGINCLSVENTNIKIRSILGRYLEHSRVYYFKHQGKPTMMISSADLMTRNTMKRIESAVIIQDEVIIQTIYRSLELQLRDDIAAYDQVNHHYEYHDGQDVQLMHYPLPVVTKSHKRSFVKRIIDKFTNIQNI
jgi:polyphosphate kinase